MEEIWHTAFTIISGSGVRVTAGASVSGCNVVFRPTSSSDRPFRRSEQRRSVARRVGKALRAAETEPYSLTGTGLPSDCARAVTADCWRVLFKKAEEFALHCSFSCHLLPVGRPNEHFASYCSKHRISRSVSQRQNISVLFNGKSRVFDRRSWIPIYQARRVARTNEVPP